MLTGRETLSRLVGKRRKILPNRQALLSAKLENSLDHQTDQNVGMPCSTAAEGSSMVGSCIYGTGGSGKGVDEVCSGSDWVTCPVCGNDVQGSAYIINAHLDACLVRGKKRKMAQSTLLQLKFCSRSQDRVCPSELSTLEASVSHKCPDDIPVQDTVCLESCSTLKSNVKVSDQNFTSKEVISYEGVTSSPPPNIHMPKLDSGGSIEDKSAAFLETFIVGRRFSDELDLKQGASVSLQRDPDNAKDPNAIKVLSNTGCPKVLGFLPRDLARYLSPLIQKYCLRFEGSVTSLPKHPLDVVPIRIMCQDMTPHQEKETNDFQVYNSLWSNAIRTVEYAKSFPLSMTKYQRNFSLLVQEVLKNDHHLFTDDEKLFLESFGSLSDDSQRLFVRLYTRKGPWFRMSNISYPEILDSKQAMTSLSESGYIQAIETTKQLHENDMEEVMDLLTVSELREILNLTFLKNGIRCTRRQDLIMSLLSSFKDGMCPQLWNLVLDLTGTCVRISSMAEYLLWRVQRLFFLNGEQDLSAFLLVDLGLVKYPVYNCSVANQTFPSRSDLLAYEEAVEVAQIMDESLDENNSDVVLRCIKISDVHISSSPRKVNQSSFPESSGIFLTCFSALWVYSNVVMLGISFLEHERRYGDAISHLQRLLVRFTCDGRRGYWTLRLSINLEHIHRLNESLCVAEEGLLDPWVRAGSKMALQRRVLRLGKPPRRWKIPSFAKSITRKIKELGTYSREAFEL